MTDLFSIEGKTALVTGGSRGIGLMIARGFVEAGARVYISSRKADVCEQVAAELSNVGTCVALPADLATESECDRLATELASREDRLDILVNNAGANWGAPIEDFPASGWDKVLDLNVKSVFYLTRALLPQLRAAASDESPARVINIGSIDGLRPPMLDTFSYSASKAAIHMLTRHMAQKLVGDRVNVNAIAPGLFPSKMTQFLFDGGGDLTFDHIPMGRAGTPDDMAGIAIFLASRASAYMTGAIVPVDGGVSTR
jgi:NAD(P)-dependent dehydrogenase (short-subunit alcohol dehydrogenase family)